MNERRGRKGKRIGGGEGKSQGRRIGNFLYFNKIYLLKSICILIFSNIFNFNKIYLLIFSIFYY